MRDDTLPRPEAPPAPPPPGRKPLVGRLRFHFSNPLVGGYFSYVLAFGARGGADVGEAFAAAARIRQYRPETWVQAFAELADRVASRADAAEAAGHRLTARDAWLRASFLARAALMALSPLREPARYRAIRETARTRFLRFAALAEERIEPVEVPFEGRRLPGYFLCPDASGARGKTLLVVGGGESLPEDLLMLFGIGDAARGYNVLTVDLPGMGSTALDGMTLDPASERPIRAIVDHALARPEVDPDRLVAFGASLGGYTLPRAAVHEKRIKAIVVNSMILDMHRYLTQARELGTLARLERVPGFRLFTRLTGSWLGGIWTLMDTWKWKWGVTSVRAWLEACRAYSFDPAGITCPTLMLVGEDEYAYPESRRFCDTALDRIAHPRKALVIGRTGTGAGGKNMLPNLTEIRALTYDWLDDVLAGR